MRIPKAIQNVIDNFERLPGIGPKSAQRLTFHLLRFPQEYLDEFAANLSELKKSTIMCTTCFNIGESEICSICSDLQRDDSVLCVVEDVLDVIAMERSGRFKGRYHVLHGIIDPLNAIGPDDIYIPQLLERIKNNELGIKEVIIATNPTMEGEATAMYLVKQLKIQNENIKVSRIGSGLPIGADIEYADEITLQRAMEGRREY
ncbi:MAG TPA: recombination mediator RecR [Candidatus Levybacteria bacterium]|nr:recombination mediator RecR [Candidatus Levybacteria bacterium]